MTIAYVATTTYHHGVCTTEHRTADGAKNCPRSKAGDNRVVTSTRYEREER